MTRTPSKTLPTSSPKHPDDISAFQFVNAAALPIHLPRFVANLVSFISYLLLASSSGNKSRNTTSVVPSGRGVYFVRSSETHRQNICSGLCGEALGLIDDLDISCRREMKLGTIVEKNKRGFDWSLTTRTGCLWCRRMVPAMAGSSSWVCPYQADSRRRVRTTAERGVSASMSVSRGYFMFRASSFVPHCS